MCVRFNISLTSGDTELEEIIAEANRRLRILAGGGAVAVGDVLPSLTAAALAAGRNGTGAFPMIWGFRRYDGKGLVVNARSETALEKPMFRQSMLERRCLIPASCYYEWEKREEGKIKYAIRPREPGRIYLAGIYRYEEDRKLPVFTVLTCDSAAEIAFIHDRMPVIFMEKDRDAWLDRRQDPEKLLRNRNVRMEFRPA